MLVDSEETMNEAVRTAFSEVDLRSARRKTSLSPNLFNGIFDYACPSDLKANAIIDIPEQAKRSDGEFFLVPSNEFNLKPQPGMIAIDDYNGSRVLKISSQVSDKTLLVSELDSTTSGGGTWAIVGDATSLTADTDDYIKGNGSLKFSISAAAGTTAGIQNTGLNVFDLTEYLGGNGAVFVWHKINSTTGITNYILKIGTDSSNYYQKTITTQADGTAFINGWNLLKFDLTSLSQTGTPTDTSCQYASIYMTKTTGKISESDYKFDWLCLKDGKNADTKYYSKFGWQTSAGAWQESSSDDSDLIVADTDEFDLLVKSGVRVAKRELDFTTEEKRDADNDWKDAAANYQLKNPSEAKIMTSEYYAY
jgi:hypothetical protein